MPEPYYQDDQVTLYHGDSREIPAWLEAAVLITDPPYGMAYEGNQRRQSPKFGAIAGDDALLVRDEVLEMWFGRARLDGEVPHAAVFGTWKQPRPKYHVYNRLVWDKTDGSGPGMGDILAVFGSSDEEVYILGGRWPLKEARVKRMGSVLRTRYSPSELTDRIGHPTPKPVGLLETLVNAAPPGTVADPFAGSGATLIAARNMGRKAIGVELEERYCEIIARRLDQMALDFGAPA